MRQMLAESKVYHCAIRWGMCVAYVLPMGWQNHDSIAIVASLTGCTVRKGTRPGKQNVCKFYRVQAKSTLRRVCRVAPALGPASPHRRDGEFVGSMHRRVVPTLGP